MQLPSNLLIHTIYLYKQTQSTDGYGNISLSFNFSSYDATLTGRVFILTDELIYGSAGTYKVGSIVIYLNSIGTAEAGDAIIFNSRKYIIKEIIDVYDFSLSHYMIIAEPYYASS